MKKIIFVMACVLSLLGVGVNTHAETTTITGNISSIQMIEKTVTKSHSKAEIEYTISALLCDFVTVFPII